MNCPCCGQPMQPGHITGSRLMRVVPDDGIPRKTYKLSDENPDLANSAIPGNGYLLDIPYSGMAPWVPVWYCLSCRKATGILDILDFGEED